MKKIMIIDGGPRKGMNTAQMLEAFNTYQMKNYDRYEFAPGTAETKQAYKDGHWQEDLQKAFDAGKQMVEKIK